MSEIDRGSLSLVLILCIGFISGGAGVLFLKGSANQAKTRVAMNRIVAHLFEFRLFADEPSVILRAQLDLLGENGRLLQCLAIPSLLLIGPFWFLIAVGEGLFGIAPLGVGQVAVVTLQFRQPDVALASAVKLEAPPGIVVETPAVRIPTESQISWRVRAISQVSGRLQFSVEGRVLTKTIAAGNGLSFLSEARAGTLWAFLLHPLEAPFSDAAVETIRLQYSPATVFGLHWLIWFSLASFAGASMSFAIPSGR